MNANDERSSELCEHGGASLVERPYFGLYRARCMLCKAWGPDRSTEEEAIEALREGVRGGRVLLVEDHRAFAEAIETVLLRSPHVADVAVAGTVRGGRDLAFGPLSFDLAVVDLRLSDGGGTELIGEIKESSPGTPVMVLSNYFDLSPGLRAGADVALYKDATIEEILGTVERLVLRSDRP